MDPLGTITAWDGIAYTITEWYPWEKLADGRWLGGLTLRDPDGEGYAVCAIVPDDDLSWSESRPIFTPYDWQEGEIAPSADDIPMVRWVDLETGAPAVMLGGLPYLSPFTAGPDARPGSYGQ